MCLHSAEEETEVLSGEVGLPQDAQPMQVELVSLMGSVSVS